MTETAKAIAIALCAGLHACAQVENGPDRSPPNESFVCPTDGFLNCMPIVPAERRSYCSADYRGWIVDNCPNVEIVY